MPSLFLILMDIGHNFGTPFWVMDSKLTLTCATNGLVLDWYFVESGELIALNTTKMTVKRRTTLSHLSNVCN